jgi:hypothetical protein
MADINSILSLTTLDVNRLKSQTKTKIWSISKIIWPNYL